MRCHRLFGRSETAREKWLQRETVDTILKQFLGTSSVPYNDADGTEIMTGALLSASATLEISPGEKAQSLHRDDFIWQQSHVKARDSYETGSDASLGILVPALRTTFENGATAVREERCLFSKPFKTDASFSSCQNHIYGLIPDGRSLTKSAMLRWMSAKPSCFSGPQCTAAELITPRPIGLFMVSFTVGHG